MLADHSHRRNSSVAGRDASTGMFVPPTNDEAAYPGVRPEFVFLRQRWKDLVVVSLLYGLNHYTNGLLQQRWKDALLIALITYFVYHRYHERV